MSVMKTKTLKDPEEIRRSVSVRLLIDRREDTLRVEHEAFLKEVTERATFPMRVSSWDHREHFRDFGINE